MRKRALLRLLRDTHLSAHFTIEIAIHRSDEKWQRQSHSSITCCSLLNRFWMSNQIRRKTCVRKWNTDVLRLEQSRQKKCSALKWSTIFKSSFPLLLFAAFDLLNCVCWFFIRLFPLIHVFNTHTHTHKREKITINLQNTTDLIYDMCRIKSCFWRVNCVSNSLDCLGSLLIAHIF